MINNSRVILSVIVILLFDLLAQPNQDRLDEMQHRLQSIKQEIDNLEEKIRTTDNKLKVETHSLENIDKQITLTHEKIEIYDNRIGSKKRLISRLEAQIDSLNQKLHTLQSIFKRQVVFAYKYQRGKHLDWLLGATNFNDALVRYRYFKKVSIAEKNSYEELQKLKRNLNEKEGKHSTELLEVKKLLLAAKQEEENLKNKWQTKSRLVSQIKQDKTLLSQALSEKKDSYEKLAYTIASLEEKRSGRQYEPGTRIEWERLSGDFLRNKGKLNWPVTGDILHGFGRFRNPKLKTVLNNTGIDIRATRGSSVRCIFPGVVSLITYLSGFGNTVIMDHNDGYYSVYAHLDEVLVNNGDFLEGGGLIGTVGESGSLEGAKLHFEIYGNNKPLNPLNWLKQVR